MRRFLCAAATLVLALTSGAVVATPATAQSPSSPTIVIRDFGFRGDLTVRPGVTVKVVNKDSVTHTLTDKKTHKWDTGDIAPSGGTASFTAPTKVGHYPFGCKIHPEMMGTLVVAVPTDPSALTTSHRKAIAKGKTARLATTLTDTKTHNRLAHAAVQLWRRVGKQGPFHRVKTVMTNARGVAHTRVGPRSTSQYKWHFSGSTGHRVATSGIATVAVHAD
jgi:plastocyanin